ncbi:hypothetical protein WICPIJ_004512 [Wickerhamomyces pijperi]|uniref:Uncharacterized protein n=1 Tax=Wickerhamomyces pijperi TaxID=599730 RepID=A0A9P8Q5I4_WICPI|nr:hypothetical protein WICPIJ_004512 [Wickerhamomyces pijperi]
MFTKLTGNPKVLKTSMIRVEIPPVALGEEVFIDMGVFQVQVLHLSSMKEPNLTVMDQIVCYFQKSAIEDMCNDFQNAGVQSNRSEIFHGAGDFEAFLWDQSDVDQGQFVRETACLSQTGGEISNQWAEILDTQGDQLVC